MGKRILKTFFTLFILTGGIFLFSSANAKAYTPPESLIYNTYTIDLDSQLSECIAGQSPYLAKLNNDISLHGLELYSKKLLAIDLQGHKLDITTSINIYDSTFIIFDSVGNGKLSANYLINQSNSQLYFYNIDFTFKRSSENKGKLGIFSCTYNEELKNGNTVITCDPFKNKNNGKIISVANSEIMKYYFTKDDIITSLLNLSLPTHSSIQNKNISWTANERRMEPYFKDIFGTGVSEVTTEIDTITITFDPQGGSCETTTMELVPGQPITDIPYAEKDGMCFKGWSDQQNSKYYINSDTIFASDKTLYAQYVPESEEINGLIEDMKTKGFTNERINAVQNIFSTNTEAASSISSGDVVLIIVLVAALIACGAIVYIKIKTGKTGENK